MIHDVACRALERVPNASYELPRPGTLLSAINCRMQAAGCGKLDSV